jgi:excisionase family DNA binding protein
MIYCVCFRANEHIMDGGSKMGRKNSSDNEAQEGTDGGTEKKKKGHKKPKSTAKGLLVSADLAKERAAQRLYDVKEAAGILNLHVMTVRKAIKEGKLIAAKLGHAYRISATDLDLYYRSCGGSGLFTK